MSNSSRDANSLTILDAKGANTVFLNKISAISAYKIDNITIDLVCFDIVIGGRWTWTIHEELPGFQAAMELLGTLPGFDSDWSGKVIQPPFAESRTTIYQRDAAQ